MGRDMEKNGNHGLRSIVLSDLCKYSGQPEEKSSARNAVTLNSRILIRCKAGGVLADDSGLGRGVLKCCFT